MALFNAGDMYACSGKILFGAGSTLTPDGELVMKESIRNRINADGVKYTRIFGKFVRYFTGDQDLYGMISHKRYGIFQIGYKPDELDMNLFKFSISQIAKTASEMPFETYHIDLSSIGNGNGEVKPLLPILEMLPDNVYLWRNTEDR